MIIITTYRPGPFTGAVVLQGAPPTLVHRPPKHRTIVPGTGAVELVGMRLRLLLTVLPPPPAALALMGYNPRLLLTMPPPDSGALALVGAPPSVVVGTA